MTDNIIYILVFVDEIKSLCKKNKIMGVSKLNLQPYLVPKAKQ